MITPTSETELRSELYFVLISESCVERVNTQNDENNEWKWSEECGYYAIREQR